MAVEVKRFWKMVELVEAEGGFAVALDGRSLKTPAKATLLVPTRALGEAIAAEWRACREDIDPRAMPMTGLANAAIDHVAPDPEKFTAELARYAEADLFCYRADGPPSLIAAQSASWHPLLAWARRFYEVDFIVTSGLVHAPQPAATIARLAAALPRDPFQVAPLSPIITIGGSLIGALALLEAAAPPEMLWQAVSLDERWQMEKWGSDTEAEAALALRRADFMAAARFLELLG